ncbi:MAG: hypothetical protein A3H98_11775 [Bacteroidetes bacterium RIFCSPLOWO2_02_FULL_36_8]|nr:MAG: hypothetical protein A3H98_11775 [Bacteroidetes bacterium RIFCSPLOWO2_02_FULL_36_8]OFY71553.1 MAG: hypothetical protein A3G23_04730 [Bacteroidetes bacterium RIFCSPLOWO2_12_FULL_37_12]
MGFQLPLKQYKKYFHLSYYFFLLSIFFQQGCCDDPKQIGVILFNDAELKVNPYIKDEEVKFKNSLDSIFIYSNAGREIIQDNWSECYHCDNDIGCCCNDYYLVECLDRTRLASNYLNSEFVITILKNYGDSYYYKNENCGDEIYFDYPNQINGPEMRIIWRYPKDTYEYVKYYFESLPLNAMKEYAQQKNWYRENLKLGTTIYQDVFTIPEIKSDTTLLIRDTIFYTTKSGIIGFKHANGSVWTLF